MCYLVDSTLCNQGALSRCLQILRILVMKFICLEYAKTSVIEHLATLSLILFVSCAWKYKNTKSYSSPTCCLFS